MRGKCDINYGQYWVIFSNIARPFATLANIDNWPKRRPDLFVLEQHANTSVADIQTFKKMFIVYKFSCLDCLRRMQIETKKDMYGHVWKCITCEHKQFQKTSNVANQRAFITNTFIQASKSEDKGEFGQFKKDFWHCQPPKT